jgi:hypothetical protein
LEIAFNTVKIDHHIVKLFEQEKATCHALPSRNSIALGCRSTNKLE